MKIFGDYYAILCVNLSLFLSYMTSSIYATKDVYMVDYCGGGGDYELVEDAIFLVYEADSSYLSCELALHSPNVNDMILVKALQVAFETENCNTDYVTIQDGDQSGLILEELCGTDVPVTSYATSGIWVTVNYEATNYNSYFKLLITRFTTTEDCDANFRCHNGRCIALNLMCDGFDNCGDDSDETSCITTNPPPTTISPSPDVYMNDHCGETQYYVAHPAIFLIYQANQARYECTLSLDTGYLNGEKFVVKAISVGFQVSDCSSDYVTVSDDAYSEVPIHKFCKSNVPNRAFTTTGKTMALKYATSKDYAYNHFKLLITKYTDSPCNDRSKFRCDNNRCIASSLVCDNWNNCGDNSDEDRGCHDNGFKYFTTVLIASITVGSVGLVAVFVMIAVLATRRRRNRRRGQAEPQPPSYGSISPTSQPYTQVRVPSYEKSNNRKDNAGSGNNDVTQTNSTINP